MTLQAATQSIARRSPQAVLNSRGLSNIYGSDDPAVKCELLFVLGFVMLHESLYRDDGGLEGN